MSTTRQPLAVGLALCALAGAAPWDGLLAPADAQSGIAIQVDAAADRRAIDPRIYGVSWGSPADLLALNAPLNRWGGNSTSRYNWQLNADNRGFDWYFESIPYDNATPGEGADTFIAESFQGGAQPMITVPLIGWMAKVGTNRSKLAGFSAAKYGAQQDCDWSWFPDACNGVLSNGNDVTGNDPNDANVPSTPAIQGQWAAHLVSRWGGAGHGGLRYYLYDNEPTLWHSTHRDARATGVRMTELRDATIAYGTAIRQADPDALLAGPEEWGWMGYFWSGYDQQYMGNTGCYSCWPDRDANGGMAFMPWLLDQLRQHEISSGTRLLDLFSLHYYPQGGEYGSDTSTAMQQRRNRSTRSLWDPSYVDESWVNDTVRLIPRMHEWVDTYYPGTEIGITEYNWGAEGHINGATTQADVLGIFGREGLDAATRWTVPASDSPTFKAMQLYRNYDGNRSTFGDTSVRASVPNPDNLSAFAAERSSDGALTVVAINKVTTSALVSVSIANFPAGATAQVWRLGASNAITRAADVAVSGGAISTTLPAQTITLFVVPRSTPTVPTLSINDVALDEGASGSRAAVFTVTLSAASSQTVTVAYATANGTATAGSDYSAASGTLSFAPGETAKTVSVAVAGDSVIEPSETFTVGLSGATNATIARPTGTGTIRNDDFPALSINDVSLAEGNSGTTNAVLTVSLSAAAPFAVSVNYATANGTATAGSDYAAQTGTLTFTPGQTSKTISIAVNGDTSAESDETLFVNLSNAVGATITDGQGRVTITNDDAAPPASAVAVFWTAAVGVTVSGNSLTKTAATGWGNAGAVSTQAIASGDGYVEFTASETTTYRMLGLSNGNANSSYTDVDFALYLAAGQIQVYEAGSAMGTFGSYATGDALRVAVTGNVVRYSRNGTVFFTSARTPVYPLLVDCALYSQKATLASAVILGASAPPPSAGQAVVWTSLAGVTATGSTLKKTAATGWGNAGAISTQTIASGDGYVEFTASETTTYRMLGLSNGNANSSYTDIDFALYLAAGQIQVYEAGSAMGTFGSYATGDTLRVAVTGGAVRYSRNGTVIFTSTKTPVYPLLVDSALYSQNATLASVVISGATMPPPSTSQAVAWTGLAGVSASGNTLKKTAATGWGNGGAISMQAIPSGDGSVEFTASETTTYRMLGLSNGNADSSYTDIDFALYLAAGQIQVYEAGSLMGTFGSYATGDKMRVAVTGGIVRYSRNGTVFFTSTKTPAYPLLVDSALYSQNATLNAAVIAGAQ
jgi:hypothetical protein